MDVLIGCENSGIIRDAFIKAGHNAISCDLLDSDRPGPHYKGDVRDHIHKGWGLFIVHPDCTYLTVSAEWCYKDDTGKKMSAGVLFGAARRQAREDALDFVRELFTADAERMALENPVGVIGTRIRKSDQIIQPHEYGHDASKRTCLWLKNLPLLTPTKYIDPRWVCCGEILDIEKVGKYGCPNCEGDRRPLPRWANQTNGGQNKLGPSADRWKLRAETYPGWADAMAAQWGGPDSQLKLF